jgi:hypothetical protein
MSACRDNQEVGLEAATLERVRNSSLVECAGADNVPGLKISTEAADRTHYGSYGRGALSSAVKVEREHGWSGDKCECRYK